jgi:hypothetical protein
MESEVLLAAIVEQWARKCLPDEPDTVHRTTLIALDCYAGGASVSEACRVARNFIRSRVSHPSNARAGGGVVPVAS